MTLPGDPNGYTLAEYREGVPTYRRTGWLSGADPVSEYRCLCQMAACRCDGPNVDDPRPEWGPSTLAEAREDLEAAYKVYDLIVAAQHQAISERNLAQAQLAQVTVERDNARAELNRIIGG